jgi:hypothetical protein
MYAQYNNLYTQIPYMDYNNLVQTLTIPLTPEMRAMVLVRLVQMNNLLLEQTKPIKSKDSGFDQDLDQELKYLTNLEQKITKPKPKTTTFDLDIELKFLAELNDKITHTKKRNDFDLDQELNYLNNLKQKIIYDRRKRKNH